VYKAHRSVTHIKHFIFSVALPANLSVFANNSVPPSNFSAIEIDVADSCSTQPPPLSRTPCARGIDVIAYQGVVVWRREAAVLRGQKSNYWVQCHNMINSSPRCFRHLTLPLPQPALSCNYLDVARSRETATLYITC